MGANIEPLAIVGLACKFPGESSDEHGFWSSIVKGRSELSKFPNDRVNIDAFYHPDPDRNGALNTKYGHFLQASSDKFDAPFFSIGKSEACCMDPQQRYMIENVYHALENAGLSMHAVSGSNTSVFIGGGFAHDYLDMFNLDPEMVAKQKSSGTSGAILANRISWFFNLTGASLTVDTACSSSLVALHQACQSLRTQDSNMAIVGGINIIENLNIMLGLSAMGMLSPDGKSYSFDHRANGYGRGEGVGTVIVKRLSDALRDRDPIRAVIRASGVNQDGRTPGITLPSQAAQENLIRRVYKDAGLDLKKTGFVEAHGTGTLAGDPIEAEALARAFDSSSRDTPLFLGSVKANIGHLEGGAGIAGLIKAVLMVENRTIPAAANFEQPNPKIPFERWNLQVSKLAVPWQSDVLRVSINSFGFGGANAHAVVDDVKSCLAELTSVDLLAGPSFSALSPRVNGSNHLYNSSPVHPEPKMNGSTSKHEHAVPGFNSEAVIVPYPQAVQPIGLTNGVHANGDHTDGVHTNGVHMNGDHTDGVHTNGVHMNGVNTDGVHTNGVHMNGVNTDGVHTNSDLTDGLHTNGVHKNGVHTDGDHTHRVHTNGDHIDVVHTNGHGDDLSRYPEEKLFIFSAFDREGIKRNTESLVTFFERQSNQHPERLLNDHFARCVSYTLASRRTIFSWSGFAVAKNLSELLNKLKTSLPPPKRESNPRNLAFVFTGQGSQWAGMGKALLGVPLFAQRIKEASRYMAELGCSWDLTDTLSQQSDDINDPCVSQSACTAIQVALVDLLASWGIRPERVVGHSSGEIAAAYCAGHISRTAAWATAFLRGSIVKHQLKQRGAMMAVGCSPEKIQELLKEVNEPDLVIACYNSPSNCTLSGSESAINSALTALQARDIFARKLKVQVAYHSQHMKATEGAYLDALKKIDLKSRETQRVGTIMYSSLTGAATNATETAQADYWVQNLVSPVRFSQALLALAKRPEKKSGRLKVAGRSPPGAVTHIVEIGPHSTLRSAITETLAQDSTLQKIAYAPTMQRNNDSYGVLLETVGDLFCSGYKIDMTTLVSGSADSTAELEVLSSLPSYSFNHSRSYWQESRLSKNYRHRGHARHDLCGTPVIDWNPDEPRWRGFLRISELPWLLDHKITGRVVLPGMGYLAMAVEAFKQIADPSRKLAGISLQDVVFKAAMTIPETPEGIEYSISMRPCKETKESVSAYWHDVRIHSCEPEETSWVEHCTGRIRAYYESDDDAAVGDQATSQDDAESLSRAESNCTARLDSFMAHGKWDKLGVAWGPLFQNINSVQLAHGTGQALCEVVVPDVQSHMPSKAISEHVIQPATLDSVLATFIPALLDADREDTIRTARLPVSLKEAWFSMDVPRKPGDKILCYSQAQPVAFKQYEPTVLAFDAATRKPVVRLTNIGVKPLEATREDNGSENNTPCHLIEWKPHAGLLTKTSNLLRPVIGDAEAELSRKESEHLASLALSYITQAVQDIRARESKELAPHHVKYMEWMDGVLRKSANGEFSSDDMPATIALPNGSASSQEVIAPDAQPSVSERLLRRVGPQISAILSGEKTAVDVLFQDSLIDDFYRELSSRGNIAHLQRQFLGSLGHTAPGLRVLEIGAGTGGTTQAVLEALSPRAQGQQHDSKIRSYTFTDISAAFFDNARQKFSAWNGILDYRVLDIEASPEGQGFETNQYDLVVASNVLHATTDLSNTIRNAQSLLKPGGKLMLVEITNLDWLMVGSCFGLLPGWWLSKEENRRSGPLLTEPDWDSMLRSGGFSGIDLTLRDYEGDDVHDMTVMISTAVPEEPPSGPELLDTTYIICLDQDQMKEDWISELRQVITGAGNRQCSIIDYHDLHSHPDISKSLCIAAMGMGNFDMTTLSSSDFDCLKYLTGHISTLLWLTTDEKTQPVTAMAKGWLRTARWEREVDNVNVAVLEISPPSIANGSLCSRILDLCQILDPLHPGAEKNGEYRLEDGDFFTPRLQEADEVNERISSLEGRQRPNLAPLGKDENRALKLTPSKPGLLDSLTFIDDDVQSTPLTASEVEVKVTATSLNFRDVMVAMGQIPDFALGLEGCGTISRVGSDVTAIEKGDTVVFFAANPAVGALHTYCRVPQAAVARIPASMTAKEACTMPITFVTVVYSLLHIARLSSSDSILIHAAAGGTGQAAIQIAQMVGADIYATVSSTTKRDYLMEHYGLPQERILASRDLSFASDIRRLTNGRGVDVVLNSLSGEALRQSWSCIAPFGRFIELGKKDILANGTLQMAPFANNVMYYAMDTKALMTQQPAKAMQVLQEAYSLQAQGHVRIPPITEFKYSELEKAFRHLQSGKTIGKVVVVPHEDDLVQVMPKKVTPVRFIDNATYVLCGGFGGLGRSLLKWFTVQGARNIVVISRSGATSAAAQQAVEEATSRGCRVEIAVCSSADKADLESKLRALQEGMPPIRGCVQGAMVLEDSTIANMTHSNLMAALGPKVAGTRNLHELLPLDMDFFIMLSSVTSIVGNRGQANYGAGNAFQDAFAHHLMSQGIRKATSINLGTVEDVGYVAEKLQAPTRAMVLQWDSLSESLLHSIISHFIQHPDAQAVTGLMSESAMKRKGIEPPSCYQDPLFAHLHQDESLEARDGDGDLVVENWTPAYIQRSLKSSKSFIDAVAIVQEGVQRKIASMMGLPWAEVEPSKSMVSYGIDSLVAVELRKWSARSLAAQVEVLDLLGRNTVAMFAEKLARSTNLLCFSEGVVE